MARLQGWYQTRPGFTTRDLGLISEQLADNWGTRYGIAGLGESTGRLLGDDAEVRVHFPEVGGINRTGPGVVSSTPTA